MNATSNVARSDGRVSPALVVREQSKAAKVAEKILAGSCIIAGSGSLLFFASPLLPMALIVFLPILMFFFYLAISVMYGNAPPNAATQNLMGEGIKWGFKISLYAGFEMGAWVYSAKVAVIAGMVFCGIIGAGALIAACAYLVIKMIER